MQRNNRIQRKGSFGKPGILIGLAGAAVVIAIVARATPPSLTITALTNGNLKVTIANAIPTNTYDIWYTPSLDNGFTWNFLNRGTPGQTNFTVTNAGDPSAFFIATDIDDFDGDGIPNWEDADPYNASVGIMTVIIDTPTNGYTFR